MSRALRSLFAFLLLLLVVSPALAGRLRQREREGPPYRLRSSPGVEQAVPEPGALVAFALGAAAVGLRARRLRRG
jgi:PEP-CTERM motif